MKLTGNESSCLKFVEIKQFDFRNRHFDFIETGGSQGCHQAMMKFFSFDKVMSG
jgi:hypothetical protein